MTANPAADEAIIVAVVIIEQVGPAVKDVDAAVVLVRIEIENIDKDHVQEVEVGARVDITGNLVSKDHHQGIDMKAPHRCHRECVATDVDEATTGRDHVHILNRTKLLTDLKVVRDPIHVLADIRIKHDHDRNLTIECGALAVEASIVNCEKEARQTSNPM